MVTLEEFFSVRIHYRQATGVLYALNAASGRLSFAVYAVGSTIVAALVSETIELRVEDQHFLGGISLRTQSATAQAVAMAAVFGAACVTVVLLASGAAVDKSLNGIASELRYPPLEPFVVTRDVAGASFLSVIVASSVGHTIACLTRSRAAAIVASLALAVMAPVLGGLQNSLPAIKYAYAITPPGALDVVLGTNINSTPSGAAQGLATTSILGAIVLGPILVAQRRESLLNPSPVHDHVGPARRRPRHLLILAAALALVLGAAVPVGLRSEVPWQLRPIWLADKRQHRTSSDIARDLLHAVQRNEYPSAAALAVGHESAESLLGPYLPSVKETRNLQVRVIERAGGDPGTVLVDTDSGSFKLCATRAKVGWRIASLTTSGDCPKALISGGG